MIHRSKPALIAAGISALAALVVTGYFVSQLFAYASERAQQHEIPPAVILLNRSSTSIDEAEASSAAPDANVAVNAAAIPEAINIRVPFTTQAPNANWDADHEEFCEEAAVLMVGRYFNQLGISGPDDAEQALQALKQRELGLFGFFKDTTAAETARLLEDQFPVTTALLSNPSVDDLKALLATGYLVIVPSAGRQLKNPNYKTPGPLYHMLVLKGYTKAGDFITNDPGTRRGADYLYPYDRVMKAMHDWNGGNVDEGAKVVIAATYRK